MGRENLPDENSVPFHGEGGLYRASLTILLGFMGSFDLREGPRIGAMNPIALKKETSDGYSLSQRERVRVRESRTKFLDARLMEKTN